MGVHDSSWIDHYWRNNQQQGPVHTPQLYITLKHFEQLKRYLHISDPREKNLDKKEWWYRLEPLASIFHKASREYYIPGSELSVDELMIQCFGRSLHTVKMPKKPIKQGYRVYALAEHGYIWTFSWSSRKQGIMEMFRYPGLTPTASMVMNMVQRLPVAPPAAPNAAPNAALNAAPNAAYSIYMDNYFNSVSLFQQLREHGYGACGTA